MFNLKLEIVCLKKPLPLIRAEERGSFEWQRLKVSPTQPFPNEIGSNF